MLPEGADPANIVVVMEPTRNAWVPLARCQWSYPGESGNPIHVGIGCWLGKILAHPEGFEPPTF
jgi:hypothetical protein